MAPFRICERSTMWKTNHTLLIVGEGEDEAAFFNYVKSIANVRNSGRVYLIRSAQGGSPLKIVEDAIGIARLHETNEKYVFYDTDTLISVHSRSEVNRKAQKNGFFPVESVECFEDILLRTKRISPQSGRQKSQIKNFLTGKSGDPASYAAHFPLNHLLNWRNSEPMVSTLLDIFQL